MFNQDPRLTHLAQQLAQFGQLGSIAAQGLYGQVLPHALSPMYGQTFAQPLGFTPVTSPVAPYVPVPSSYPNTGIQSSEIAQLSIRLDEIRVQVAAIAECIRLDMVKKSAADIVNQTLGQTLGQTFGQNFGQGLGQGYNAIYNQTLPTAFGTQTRPYGTSDISPVRLRESDAHVLWEIFLPNLTMGDVEVEVSGNRITCRTRVPVAPVSRWWTTVQIPRSFDVFELADGRVEFSWIAPVAFQTKEVEATWRDGFLCVCIPKSEVHPRHTVKVVKETGTARRAANDMNS